MKIEFWSKINIRGPDECWPWLGCCDKQGYGFAWYEEKWVHASRVAYNLTHKIKLGKWHCRHTCDNPPCCNPRHLRRGTRRQNALDAIKQGKVAKLTRKQVAWARRECSRGHSQSKLARVLRVSQATVNKLVNKITWR